MVLKITGYSSHYVCYEEIKEGAYKTFKPCLDFG